jgi:CRP-like cAMP-binding protein
MNKVEELGKSSLFRDLPESERKKLASIAHPHSFNAQDKIMKQGELAEELTLIVLGTVKLIRRLDTGEEEEVIVLGSGSYFGEFAVVNRGEVRAVTVYAMEKTFALVFSADELNELCDNDPVLGHHVFRAIAKASARRIRTFIADTAYFKSLSKH